MVEEKWGTVQISLLAQPPPMWWHPSIPLTCRYTLSLISLTHHSLSPGLAVELPRDI